jgi:transposase-like protein
LYLGWMRYPDGGGLTAAGRVRREAVRLQAAEMFAQEVSVPEIAERLRVSQNAVYVWRRKWLADGEAGLVSKGLRVAGAGFCRRSWIGWPPR